jgi:hypothetical protein
MNRIRVSPVQNANVTHRGDGSNKQNPRINKLGHLNVSPFRGPGKWADNFKARLGNVWTRIASGVSSALPESDVRARLDQSRIRWVENSDVFGHKDWSKFLTETQNRDLNAYMQKNNQETVNLAESRKADAQRHHLMKSINQANNK